MMLARKKAVDWMVKQIEWEIGENKNLEDIKKRRPYQGSQHYSVCILYSNPDTVEVELEMGKAGVFRFKARSIFNEAMKIWQGQQLLF